MKKYSRSAPKKSETNDAKSNWRKFEQLEKMFFGSGRHSCLGNTRSSEHDEGGSDPHSHVAESCPSGGYTEMGTGLDHAVRWQCRPARGRTQQQPVQLHSG